MAGARSPGRAAAAAAAAPLCLRRRSRRLGKSSSERTDGPGAERPPRAGLSTRSALDSSPAGVRGGSGGGRCGKREGSEAGRRSGEEERGRARGGRGGRGGGGWGRPAGGAAGVGGCYCWTHAAARPRPRPQALAAEPNPQPQIRTPAACGRPHAHHQRACLTLIASTRRSCEDPAGPRDLPTLVHIHYHLLHVNKQAVTHWGRGQTAPHPRALRSWLGCDPPHTEAGNLAPSPDQPVEEPFYHSKGLLFCFCPFITGHSEQGPQIHPLPLRAPSEG